MWQISRINTIINAHSTITCTHIKLHKNTFTSFFYSSRKHRIVRRINANLSTRVTALMTSLMYPHCVYFSIYNFPFLMLAFSLTTRLSNTFVLLTAEIAVAHWGNTDHKQDQHHAFMKGDVITYHRRSAVFILQLLWCGAIQHVRAALSGDR